MEPGEKAKQLRELVLAENSGSIPQKMEGILLFYNLIQCFLKGEKRSVRPQWTISCRDYVITLPMKHFSDDCLGPTVYNWAFLFFQSFRIKKELRDSYRHSKIILHYLLETRINTIIFSWL